MTMPFEMGYLQRCKLGVGSNDQRKCRTVFMKDLRHLRVARRGTFEDGDRLIRAFVKYKVSCRMVA